MESPTAGHYKEFRIQALSRLLKRGAERKTNNSNVNKPRDAQWGAGITGLTDLRSGASSDRIKA